MEVSILVSFSAAQTLAEPFRSKQLQMRLELTTTKLKCMKQMTFHQVQGSHLRHPEKFTSELRYCRVGLWNPYLRQSSYASFIKHILTIYQSQRRRIQLIMTLA